jgi:glutaminase
MEDAATVLTTTASPLLRALSEIHAEIARIDAGEVATYIPSLANADPSLFGICIATADGHLYCAGDTSTSFTIQSISKPFAFALALEDLGTEAVLEHVGVEPSGDAFNSITVDQSSGKPFNPMVNAGAIATTDLLSQRHGAATAHRIQGGFSAFAGSDLTVDEDVYHSERSTGDRNRAITYLLKSLSMVGDGAARSLDTYFQQCSILVTAESLALMGATLANGGRNARTGNRVLSADNVSRVLSVMSTCGMYDYAGHWLYEVGMPAKSGVSGGILAVLPGNLAVAVYAPPLDSHGNSVKGIEVCRRLSERFGFHLMHESAFPRSPVSLHYRGNVISSKRLRDSLDTSVLTDVGSAIGVYELQGDLNFATLELLCRAVLGEEHSELVVFDCRALDDIDAACLELLNELIVVLVARGVQVVFSGAQPDRTLGATLRGLPAVIDLGADAWHHDVDAALERCEDELLERVRGPAPERSDHSRLEDQDLLRGLSDDHLAAIAELIEIRRVSPGSTILKEGDSADDLHFVLSGSVSVLMTDPQTGTSTRITTLGPGAAFGEMALIDGSPRSSSVRTDDESDIGSIRLRSLEDLSADVPEVSLVLYRNLARILATRLRRNNAELTARQQAG